eukprot:CAMPEP_0197527480 /NCGR_PEP_ID=MMETSP1318-20131121/21827_1 /TAXON_ID=552666 /ORGANISM="Partenskyella glossopodia, Strain RCC365" /LENGTH=268 /DNA_ID=CAMNT_0043082155 /DNA_START=89 /DNA_END=895 /DNA_ORIENTATION=+
MFKKIKRRRRKNFRESSSDALKEDKNDDGGVSSTLEEVKFLQKYRGKARGLKAGIEEPEEEEEEEVQNTADEPSAHFLGAYQQGVQEVGEDEKESKYMEMFIEEELKKRRKGESRAGQDDNEGSSSDNRTKKLDETEEMLKKINEEGKMTERRGNENWASGITEVPLPISVKLKNIEDTERAKQKLLRGNKDGNKRKRDGDRGNVNYSTNFNQHERNFQKRLKERRQHRAGPEKPNDSEKTKKAMKGERVPYATDDRVVARFIKRNRR